MKTEEQKLKPIIRGLYKLLMQMPEEPENPPEKYNYTDWCTGADGTRKQPYQRQRNRQCSIGYHGECSDPAGKRCGCPCHLRVVKQAIKALHAAGSGNNGEPGGGK